MTQKDILRSIGLSPNEAKVYMILNKLGNAPAGKVAEEAKLHRTNVYDALERLLKRGLVSHITKDNVRIFSTTDPNNLLSILKEKELELTKVLPQLKLNHQLSQISTKASVFEGTGALRNIMQSFLDYNKPILVYGIPEFVPDLVKNWIETFHIERIERKVIMKHIYNAGAQSRIEYLNSLPFTKAKNLTKDYDSPISTFVCGDEVLLCMWDVEPILLIKIENKNLAEAYERYFELMWKMAED